MRILQLVVSRHTLALAACAAAVACGSETTTESSFVAPEELSVQPSVVTVAIGSSIKLSAAFPAGAGARALPSEILWRSASDSIASITAAGTVRGVKTGRTRVTATWRGSHGTAIVTVVQGGTGKRPVCASAQAALSKAGIPKSGGPCR